MKRYRFRNGLRVILVPQKGVAATVLILVAAGSEYETKRTNGVSHFLEHMVFKGTEKRPKPGMTAEALDALGAEYNAFTGQEYTGYWAKAEKRKLPELMELISDLHLHPMFDAREIEKERGVIIEELNMYEDIPMRKIHDVFLSLLYGDQPAGWDVGGEKDIIRKLTRRDFTAYRDARYVAPSTVVILAGDFKEKEALAMVKRTFGHLPRKTAPQKSRTKEAQNAPRVLVRHKASDQSHLVVGVRTFSLFDRRRYAAELLAHTLGGGMSSRLFRRVRDELGAAYYIRAENSLSLDHGYLAVSAGVNNPKLMEVLRVVLEECARLKNEPVAAPELRRIKDHYLGTFKLGLETSDELASFYGEQEIMTGRLRAPDEFAGRLEAVTPAEIQGLAREIFVDTTLNLAVIGPLEDDAELKKILRFPG